MCDISLAVYSVCIYMPAAMACLVRGTGEKRKGHRGIGR